MEMTDELPVELMMQIRFVTIHSVLQCKYVYIDGTLCRSQLEDAVIEGVSGEVGGQSLWDRGGKAGAPPAALTAKGAVYVVYTYLHIEYGGEY
jgi:hypothetical protein